MKKQATIYQAIMKKCKCKVSNCKNLRCPCRKDGSFCSSFCECQNCVNLKEVPLTIQAADLSDEEDHESDITSEEEANQSNDELYLSEED